MELVVGSSFALGVREQRAQQVEPHRAAAAGAGGQGPQRQAVQGEVRYH